MADDFDREPNYARTATNPAAPEGLRQVAAEDEVAAAQGLKPWHGPSYLGAAQDWYGGRNLEGENNGWSTDFMARAFDYTDAVEARAGQEKNPLVMWNMFDAPTATGVATWNDPQGRWKLGDVYDNGVRVRNLYEDMDSASADLMLADFMFTGDDKAAIFSDSDRVNRLAREVSGKAEEWSKAAEAAPGAYQFDKDTQERQENIQDWGGTPWATGLAAAGASAAMGATAGAALGPVGALVGGVVGGGVGALGAWLNQDQLTEQLARTIEISERAYGKYDPIRATLVSSSEWAGLAMRGISPFSNAWQGLADAMIEGGRLGDGRSEFYEVDMTGERKAGALWQVGDIAATLGDSVLQFASPAGRGMYMGVMGTMGVGGLLGNVTTAATFNLRTGDFDSFESASEWIGGIGSPLIDVAQMGMARAVTQAATRFGREADQLSDAARTTYTVERGSMRFEVSRATGEVVDHRTWTFGALAPSENIWQVPIRWKARTIAMKSGRTEVTGDDLFAAALTLTAPASRWRGALVNGVAEAYEEAWQGILDPMSVSEDIDGRAVFVQALYGAAGGVGMSAGALMQRSGLGKSAWADMPMAQVEFNARLNHALRSNEPPMDAAQWNEFKKGLSEQQLRDMAVSSTDEARDIGMILGSVQEQLTIDNTRGSIWGDPWARAITELKNSGLSGVNPNAEEVLSILAFENATVLTQRGTDRPERVLRKRVEAIRVQLEAAVDDAMRTEVQTRLGFAEALHRQIAAEQVRLSKTQDIQAAKQIILKMNLILRNAYDGKVRVGRDLVPPEEQAYWRKAATIVLGRHPFLDTGSFAGFIPQVSFAMSAEGSHSAVGINQAMLKPMQADHDGDRTTTINLAYLPDSTIEMLRKGLQQFAPKARETATVDPVTGETSTAVEGSLLEHNIDMPDGESSRLLVYTEELAKPATTAEHKVVASALDDIEQWVIRMFADRQVTPTPVNGGVVYMPGQANPAGPLPWTEVTTMTREFRRRFAAGDEDALPWLRNRLLNVVGAGTIGQMSEREPVLLALHQYYNTRLARATASLARLRLTSTTSTVLIDVRRPEDVTNQTAVSRGQAATVSQMVGMMGHNEPTRDSQMLWYSPITRVLADVRDNGWTPASVEAMARMFVEDTTGDGRTEMEKFLDKNEVQGRVLAWLDGIVKDVERSTERAFVGRPAHELRIILSMMQVPAMERVAGEPFGVANGENISLLQFLMRKSINIETDNLRNVPESDDRWKKLKSLKALTYDNGPHSYTPKTAAIEMLRFLPAEDVVGTDDADYLGGNTTLDQKITELTGMHEAARSDAIERLKRSPAYMREEHRGLGDPPYSFDRLLNDRNQLRVNAYTLAVDALEAEVNNIPARYARRNEKASSDFIAGFTELQKWIGRLRTTLLDVDPGREYTDEYLLTELIRNNSRLADMIIALVPEAAYSGTFLVEELQVYAAPWLMTVLLEKNPQRAEKNYFIFKHMNEFNFAGSVADTRELADDLTSQQREEAIAAQAAEVDYDRLKSRFQQTLHIAASYPDGFLLGHLLQIMDSAENVHEMLDRINAIPALRADRAELLAYVDDVALFESRPEDLWSMGLTSTQLLEALSNWGSRVKMMSDSAFAAWTQDAVDRVDKQDVLTLLETGKVTSNAEQNLELLRQAVRNQRARPDAIGPTARQDFFRMCWDPLVRLEDKGAAPEVARFVEAIVTSYTFGVRQAWEQGIDHTTALQWSDVATNVTKLLEGPVQIMMPDGKTLILDMTDETTLMRMWMDPRTSAFVDAVVFETVRDVDSSGRLQHYGSTATDGSWSGRLAEQNGIDLMTMDDPSPRTRTLKAHRGFGIVESAIVKKAMTGTIAEQGQAMFPITRAVGEILTAYTTRPDLDGVDRDEMTNDVLQDMWILLVNIASKTGHERELIKKSVLTTLRARAGGTGVMEELQKLYDGSPMLRGMFDKILEEKSDQLLEMSITVVEEARAHERERERLPEAGQRTQQEQDHYDTLSALAKQSREESDRLLDQAEKIRARELKFVDNSLFSAQTIQDMYVFLDETEAGIGTDEQIARIQTNMVTRLNIRNLLEMGNNKEAFSDKGVPRRLLDKLALITEENKHRLHDGSIFDDGEWEQLSMWAATIHFTNESERSADQALRSMGKPEVDRLYDRTYSYLTDVLFNETILEEVKALINPTLAAMPSTSMTDIANRITGRLLSEDRLGPWNSTLVPETLKIATMLNRGAIGLFIPAGGSHPVRQRSQFGTAKATTTLPIPDEHLTTITFDPRNVDPAQMRWIMNGFFTELTLTNDTQGTPPLDISRRIGAPSNRDGMDPSYMILRRANWEEAFEKMAAAGEYAASDSFTVTITFVDPDKKPFTPQYENSVYFDKAGRNEEFTPLEDVISASISSQNGWSKISQQRLFDVPGRGGTAGFPTPTIPLATVQGITFNPDQAGDYIRRLAHILLTKQYNDMEDMLDVDQAAVIKLLKQRMVVVGEVSGVRLVRWMDEVIANHANDPFDTGTAQVVELSEEVAITLLSERGMGGKPGLVSSTEVNPSQMATAGSLSPERLKQLGLSSLGETIEWDDPNSPLYSFSPLSPASMSDNRGEPYMRTYRQRLEQWRKQASLVVKDTPMEQTAWRERNAERMDDLESTLGQNLMLHAFQQLGMSPDMVNKQAVVTDLKARSRLASLFGDEMLGRRIFTYTTTVGDKNLGHISRDLMENDFSEMEKDGRPPVYGDFVIIDLDQFVEGALTDRDYDAAARKVQEVMEGFGKRGVRIFLKSTTTSHQVKERIAIWMQGDPMGYEGVHDSTTVYIPIIEFGSEGKTARALRRSLTERYPYNPRNVVGRILSDEWFPPLGANEGTVLVDTDYDGPAFWRMAQILLPGDVTIADERGGISLNYPTPSQMAQLQKHLLPLVEDDATWEKLLGLTNATKKNPAGDPKKADPAGTPIYSKEEFAGGRELLTPGILSAEVARERLIAMLKSGQMFKVNSEIFAGEFLPVVHVSRDGKHTIVLSRVGFKLPTETQITAQWDTQYNPNNPVKIAMSSNRINDAQTIPPPMKITEIPRNHGNGLLVVGQFEHHKWGKWIDAFVAYKAGRIKMTTLRATGPLAANGFRHSEYGSLTQPAGKRTTGGTINNFQDLFELTGWDVRNLLVDAFIGKQTNEDDYKAKWSELQEVLRAWGKQPFGYTEDAVYRMMTLEGLTASWQEFNAFMRGEAAVGVPRPSDVNFLDDPAVRIPMLVVMSLMAPRVTIDDIASVPGMMTVADRKSETLQVVPLPPLLTKALQDPNTPKTTKWLFDMANRDMPPGTYFDTNFKFHTRMERVQQKTDGTEAVEDVEVIGWFQLVKPTAATEDLNAYAQASNKSRRDESLHIAGVLNSALGAHTVLQKDFEEGFKELTDGRKIIRFGDAVGRGTEGTLWQMLTRIKPREDQPFPLTPLQMSWVIDGNTDLRGYTMAYDKSGWSEDDADRIRDMQSQLLRELGLDRNIENQRIEIDYLVRQFYGSPGRRAGQKDFIEPVKPEDYYQAVKRMLWFAERNRNPLEGAKVPHPHEALWRKIYEAGKWRPVLGRGDRTRIAGSWEEAVYALFGQLEQSRQMVDSRFRRPMDAFMRTYADTIPALKSVAVSGDEEINKRLLDVEANQPFITLDPGLDSLLSSPVILAEMEKTITNLLGITRDFDPAEMGYIDSSSLMAHLERVDRWANKQGLTPQVKTSYLEYLEVGTEYLGRSGKMHTVMSSVVNLSLMNRLFNPSLFVSALVEVPMRMGLESFTNIVTGDQLGVGGMWQNKLANVGEKVTGSRWSPRYDEREIGLLRALARQLAGESDFMEYLYKELMFTHLVEPGRGGLSNRIEKGTGRIARAFSDPTWGMPANSVALQYLSAVLEHMAFSGAHFTVESFVQQMEQDPLFLVKNSRDEGGFSAHKAGVNRVAQLRALKPTVLSKAIMGPINSMTQGRGAYNFMGHMLKIPFMFTTFNLNALTTMTGLGGVDQIMAMWLDGRNRPGFINRMDASVRGVKPQKETWDMSDVLEGIDLSRAFIRGGVTQTALFATALLASGLGLGGEDDEMRKRRKLAEYLNTPLFLDPREIQNDFLYANALFLDNIPILGTIFKDDDMPPGEERSVVIPHWIISQFTSPMMGTMRFLETGDTEDIRRGFANAFSALPYSIGNLWQEASDTADQLFGQAKELDYEGNSVEAQAKVTQLLVNAVSIYEKALIENSFINGLRNNSDQWNRNPWIVPATDETGNILMREGTNDMPLRSQALESFIDPETGQERQAYSMRTGIEGIAHGYAENNLSFSLLASLFTGQIGGDSSYLRNNMVVGETKIDLPPTTPAGAEALFYSAYAGQGGQQNISFDEAVRVVKAQYEDAGVRWKQSKVEEQAQQFMEAANGDGRFGAMSVLSKDGQELITAEGAEGIFHSLGKGVPIEQAALIGVWVDMPTRKAIEEKWATELIQEGVDLGLSQQSAEFRMRRIMRGDDTNPGAPGLRDILYDDKIPYSGVARYNQLNMTFMMGPDGKPWATPFQRPGVAAALGIPWPQVPAPAGPGMRKDQRGKLIDEVYGINLGVHGLRRQLEEPPEKPDESALDKAAAKTYTQSSSAGFTPFKRFASGGYNSYGPGFSRMDQIPRVFTSPRPDDIPFINTNSPYIRRARVNTERITSDRGRLKQWQ